MSKRPQTASEGHGSADPAQRAAAVAALLSALGDDGAAKAAGVSARTVRRWRTTDEAFKAELAEGLQALKGAYAEQSSALLGKAMKVLGVALDEGDATVALGVFRILTATKLEHSGPEGGPVERTIVVVPASDLDKGR